MLNFNRIKSIINFLIMKKSTFFTGLLTLMFSTSAIAQDLTIEACGFYYRRERYAG